jgi:PAS domain S-box-containing protein
LLLGHAAIRLRHHRRELLPPVATCLVAAVLLSAAAEAVLVASASGLPLASVVGHVVKGLSFYAAYCAIVQKGFREPARRFRSDLAAALDDVQRGRDLAQRYLDIAGVIIVALDCEGRVVLVNPKGAAVLGCAPSDLIGVDFIGTFVVAGERDSLAMEFRRVVGEGAEVCARGLTRIITRRGDERSISWRALVMVGDDGVAQTLCSGEDITGQLEAVRQLAASEEKYRSLFVRSMDAICLASADGILLDANPAYLALFGIQPEDIGAANVRDSCVDPAACVSLYRESGQKEAGTVARVALRKADGSVMDCRASVVPLRDERGGMVAFQSLVRDVTQETLAQAQLRESREQLRRLARRIEAAREEERTGIARELHDQLGQALTALRMDLASVARSLERGRKIDPDMLGRMTDLVDTTVRDVQRISSDLRPGIIDDLGFAEAVKWQLARFRERTRIACQFTSSVDGVGLSRAASTALFRVLQELLTNIARHASARRVRVEVSGDSDTIVLTVSDDGRGITPEQIDGRDSLGLIGIRERVLALGGTVDMHGEPGRGTTSRITLPLC